MAPETNTDWVEHRRDLHVLGCGGPDLPEHRLDVVDHRQRGRVAVLEDGQQHGTAAVGAHDVLLRRPAVAHVGDVAHQDRAAVHHLHRHRVDAVDRFRHRVEPDRELGAADLGEAGRHGDILRGDGVGNVLRGQPVRLQRVQVDVDHDLPRRAAVRRRHRGARIGRERLADAVLGVVVELLLGLLGRRHHQLDHGHRGGGEAHHHRRLDARGKHRAHRVGRRHDLRDREVDAHVGLEVDPLDGDALQRGALHAADAADVVADRDLGVGRDPRFHLGRVETGVGPHHRNHRDIHFRQHVLRHHHAGADAGEQDQDGEHVEGIAELEGVFDEPHASAPDPLEEAGRQGAQHGS